MCELGGGGGGRGGQVRCITDLCMSPPMRPDPSH